ncbi:MAG: NUDIX hydrolase [Nitrolancea sp.]
MLSKGMRWAREIQAIAQTGLSYAPDPFDVERYQRLQEIAAEMMAAGDESFVAPLQSLFAAEVGHATPKVDVRSAVFRDGTILLVQETEDGLWTLPGGWVDPGESPSEAAARETLEESGYRVTVRRLLAIYDRDRHAHPPMAFHIYKLFFDCEIVAGDAMPSTETNDVRFFPLNDLPPLSIDRVLPEQIARLYALHLVPSLPADFD